MDIETICSSLPVIETDRLRLRKVTIGDLADIYTYGSNPNVSKYVTWETHQSKDDTLAFLNMVVAQYESNKLAMWGIELKETQQLIGTISYLNWLPRHKKAEIGYVLSEPFWNRGLMTEAVSAVIQFGFNHMGLVRIHAKAFFENAGSQRVMEKAGMTYEGTLRKDMYVKGRRWDTKLYAVLKEDLDG